MAQTRIDLAGLAGLLRARPVTRRTIVAVAGPPGSGKSTLAEALAERLNSEHPGRAAVLPMDGYHYDDLLLVPMGLRPRKGAPETFDVAGLRHVLGRLRANDEVAVAVPVFDRGIEIARAAARLIQQSVPVIIVEGNYLLLRDDPWASLRLMFDLTVLIDTPEPVLRDRLVARWQGFGLTPDEIAWKLDGNDLPNGRLVIARSSVPDFRLED